MTDHVIHPLSAETAASPRNRRIVAASLVFVTTNAAVFLFLAIAIVPYWQELSGEQIQDWFADPFSRFSWMMVPVHLLAIGTTITAFVVERRRSGNTPWIWWAALGGLLISQAFNFTIYGTVLNPDLASQTLDADEALDTLDTWATLHLIRTGFVVIAVAALAAIMSGSLKET